MDKRIAVAISIVLFAAGVIFLAQFVSSTSHFLVQHPAVPVGVAGYVHTKDGGSMGDAVNVTVYNKDNGRCSNETTMNSAYAASLQGRDGDTIYVYVYHGNDYGCNMTTVDTDVGTQWCNITIGEHLCSEGKEFPDWLYLLLASGCFICSGGVYYSKKNGAIQ